MIIEYSRCIRLSDVVGQVVERELVAVGDRFLGPRR